MSHRLNCVICTKEFHAERTDALYCSPKCRNHGWRQKHRKLHNLICNNCTKTYTALRSDSLFCCSTCRHQKWKEDRYDSTIYYTSNELPIIRTQQNSRFNAPHHTTDFRLLKQTDEKTILDVPKSNEQLTIDTDFENLPQYMKDLLNRRGRRPV